FFVVDAILIGIRNRATLVAGETCFVRTLIFFIIQSVLVGIRYRATVVFRETRNSRAFIYIIKHAVLIRICRRSWRSEFPWFGFVTNSSCKSNLIEEMIIGCFVGNGNPVLRTHEEMRIIEEVHLQTCTEWKERTCVFSIQ